MTTWSLIKKNYKEIYKHIFPVLLTSFTWFPTAGLLIIASIIGFEAKFFLPVLLALVFVGPATAGGFYVTNKVVNYEQVKIRDFFVGAKRYFLPAMGVNFLLTLAVFVISVDFHYFLNSNYKILNLTSAVWIYIFIFLSMLSLYIFPLLIEFDRLDKEYSFFDLFKYSFLFTMNEVKYTLIIFLTIVMFAIISGGIVVGLPTLFMGGISLMANNTTVNLLVKYGIKEEMQGPNDFSY
ncbi:hypothetical protein JCM16358_20130 [Halanaerocella petrolearia]